MSGEIYGKCDTLKDSHLQAKYCVNWKANVKEPLKVEGGAPHGFGVWVEGKYHPVDIGALGTLISDLQQWKDAAIKSTLDPQRIGKALEFPVGTDVNTNLVLNEIFKLKMIIKIYRRHMFESSIQ